MTHVEPADHYLFAYFTSANEDDGEQVRFARSQGRNALRWEMLNAGKPLIKSSVGTEGIRDPFLVRAAGLQGESSKFYLLGTDLNIHKMESETAWSQALLHGSRSIVISTSNDLVCWSSPRIVEVLPKGFGNVWAPEAVFDEEKQKYFVFWASTSISNKSVPSHNRMLAAWTKDFVTFSEPFTWVDPGWSVIDATLVRSGSYWYRVIKDERSSTSTLPGAKFLTIERSQILENLEYEFVSEAVGSLDPEDGRIPLRQGEGPILVWSVEQSLWYLFIDEYTLRGYVPFQSPDLLTNEWSMSRDYELPSTMSHGSILAISYKEWQSLEKLPSESA